MPKTITRKRALIAGAAALLIAGVSTGGALVTAESTVFGNRFASDTITETPALIEVTGGAMNASFTGTIDGEVQSKYLTVENKSDATTGKDVKVNVGSVVRPEGKNGQQLAQALSTRVSIDGAAPVASGKLADMALGSDFTVPKGGKVVLRVDVFVASTADWSPSFGDDSVAVVDFEFNTITTKA